MKRLLSVLVSMLCASRAFAAPAAPQTVDPRRTASALVEKQLVTPLTKAQGKRKRFSRAAPLPVERRVRVTDAQPQTDARGREFLRFAVDQRFAWNDDDDWNEATLTGCVYVSSQEVFVAQGDDYVRARSLVGRGGEPVPDVCKSPHGA